MEAKLVPGRPALRLLDSARSTLFCGHCGEHSAEAESRVCRSCGLGLLLRAEPDDAPRPGDAFLIVDRSLSVQAVSAGAELELGVREAHAINRHVTELLIGGEAEPPDAASLAVAIARAASGGGDAQPVTVRPSHTFGVRLRARIAACGPPQAVLVVLDQAAGVS
ncbi:MAG TPA: hypothetical protein VG410_03980 [Solirubrobacteraceae bacterium]|jgi:ribosomal protein L37E|nr:hypothetical protein [Solirubrobacteraceae bacterium]